MFQSTAGFTHEREREREGKRKINIRTLKAQRVKGQIKIKSISKTGFTSHCNEYHEGKPYLIGDTPCHLQHVYSPEREKKKQHQ